MGGKPSGRLVDESGNELKREETRVKMKTWVEDECR